MEELVQAGPVDGPPGGSRGYLGSIEMSQSFGPEELTTTLEFGGTVTALLTLPSAERTVTDNPPPMFVLAETFPPPAVTVDDIPPAELLTDGPLPLVAAAP